MPASPQRSPVTALVCVALIGLAIAAAHLDRHSGTAAPIRSAATAPSGLRREVVEAIRRGVDYLIARQSPDGTWGSEVYGNWRDGVPLTPLVVKALLFVDLYELSVMDKKYRTVQPGEPADMFKKHEKGEKHQLYESYGIDREALGDSVRRGCDAIARWSGGGVGERVIVQYPVYTAAMAVIVLTRHPAPEHRAARDRWLATLRDHQLDEHLGWPADDPSYGGWSYAVVPPRWTERNQSFAGNLSATLFALAALRMTGALDDEPAIERARRFVHRCQSAGLHGDVDARDPSRDGGFFMSPTDAAANKAGWHEDADLEVLGAGFRSYGGMTADGLRALVLAGEPSVSPRVRGARAWLIGRAEMNHVPGDFTAALAPLRDAYYFYYVWSLAHALARTDGLDPAWPRWPEALAEALVARQLEDGSFRNALGAGREDDPLVATPLALGALGSALRHWPR